MPRLAAPVLFVHTGGKPFSNRVAAGKAFQRSMPGLAEDVVDRVVTEVDDLVDDEVTVEAPVRGDGPQRSAVIAASATD